MAGLADGRCGNAPRSSTDGPSELDVTGASDRVGVDALGWLPAQSPAECDVLGDQGRRSYSERPSFSRGVERMVHVYEGLARGNGGVSRFQPRERLTAADVSQSARLSGFFASSLGPLF